MFKKASTIWRFLLPIVILLIIAPVIFYQYLASQQLKLIELNAKDQVKSVINMLHVADALSAEDNHSEIELFKSYLSRIGHPHIQDKIELNGQKVPNLKFGSTIVTNNNKLIDQVSKLTGDKLSLFVKHDAGFIRVAGNLYDEYQNRMLADTIGIKDKVYQSLLAGLDYKGIEDFAMQPYIVRYSPLYDGKNNIIGAYYVAHKVDYQAFANALNHHHHHMALENAVTVVLNQQREVLFYSNSITLKSLQQLLAERPNDWVFVSENIPNWNYQVVMAYPLNEARAIGLNNILLIVLGGTILGVLLICTILWQLKSLILKPIGADPELVMDVMRNVANGNLADDDLTAEPNTLLANALTMRSKLKTSFSQLQENAQRLSLSASVFEHAHDGIFIASVNMNIIEVNYAFTKITGYSREAVIHHTPAELGFAFHDVNFFEKALHDISCQQQCRGEVWNLHNDGNVYVAWLDIFPVYDEAKELKNYVGLFSDITEVKVQQKNLEHMAYHDSLTQLPNRLLFSDQLNKELNRTKTEEGFLAICYLDLDGFKQINDDFGHEAGDYLLASLATRVRACLSDNDTIARIGGDEFALLLSELTSKEECAETLDRLLEVIKLPYDISGVSVKVSASIGYTLYPTDLSEPDTLLRHADHAMYHVKVSGRGFHHEFDADYDRQSRNLIQEREAIAEALFNGEFRLFYQPKVNMLLGSVVGMEALIRWQHPKKGLRTPSEFLPMLEHNTELAVQIGEWVISEALRQINAWKVAELTMKVSVNISARHMMKSNFSERLKFLLSEYPKVAPRLLELEITETAVIEDLAVVARTITECKELGVSFALDDFGVGYSSLTYLRRLPVEVIKIDQSFIRDMLQDSEDLAVVSGVISLGNSFGLDVVAEGVETAEHGVQLLKIGCEVAQGYGISKPMEAKKVLRWVRTYQPDVSWLDSQALSNIKFIA